MAADPLLAHAHGAGLPGRDQIRFGGFPGEFDGELLDRAAADYKRRARPAGALSRRAPHRAAPEGPRLRAVVVAGGHPPGCCAGCSRVGPFGPPAELDLGLARLRPVGEFAALQRGVDLLCRHRDGRIVIVGDFDADGATSAALMVLGLRALGFAEVTYFIPDRFELGYGLTPEVVNRLDAKDPSLIVTVDNGITSTAGVAAAREANVEVLITDHHLPGAELPAAHAIINPNLPGEPFAGKSLAGVGVAFYLLAALGRRLGTPALIAGFLDLVALGTVADLVMLDHSNRVLISQGLARLRAGVADRGWRRCVRWRGVAVAR